MAGRRTGGNQIEVKRDECLLDGTPDKDLALHCARWSNRFSKPASITSALRLPHTSTSAVSGSSHTCGYLSCYLLYRDLGQASILKRIDDVRYTMISLAGILQVSGSW